MSEILSREQTDHPSRDEVSVRRLAYSDLPNVISIERRSFPTPWSLAMFVLELSKPSGICLAATRGEVFVALYDADGATLWEPAVMRPEALAERLAQVSAPPSVGGSGAIRFRDELEGAGGIRIPDDADPVHRVAARHVCALAAAGEGSESLEPIYLRPPDAERWRERDSFQRAD